jgi:hypothetical protein
MEKSGIPNGEEINPDSEIKQAQLRSAKEKIVHRPSGALAFPLHTGYSPTASQGWTSELRIKQIRLNDVKYIHEQDNTGLSSKSVAVPNRE